MKDQIRILGIDDGPFKFGQKRVLVIGVIMRAPHYIEGICSTRVAVDGKDANTVLEKMINKSNYKDQLRLIMLDGVALGGFNIVDINELYKSTNIPVITITRDKPNFDKIKVALSKHFKDWKERWMILKKGEIS